MQVERTLSDVDRAQLRNILTNYNGLSDGLSLVLKELSMVALDEGIWFRNRPLDYRNEQAARIWARVSGMLEEMRMQVLAVLNAPRS